MQLQVVATPESGSTAGANHQQEGHEQVFGRHGNFTSLNNLRDSSLVKVAFTKFEVIEANRSLAVQQRQTSEELLQLRDEAIAVHKERGKERVREEKERERRSSKAKREMQERSRAQARAAHRKVLELREALEQRRLAHFEEMREHVLEQKAMVASLSAVEEAQAKERRREGADRREQISGAVAAMRERLHHDKRQVASRIRTEEHAASSSGLLITTHLTGAGSSTNVTHGAAHGAASSSIEGEQAPEPHEQRIRACLADRNVVRAAKQAAREVRRAERAWKRDQEDQDGDYAEHAKEVWLKGRTQRERTRAALADSYKDRKKAAENQRMVWRERKESTPPPPPRANHHHTTYGSRFASKEAAALFDSSPWHALTSWFIKPPKPPKKAKSTLVVL